VATAADHAAIVARSLALFHEDPGTKPMTAARVRRTLAVLEREPARGVAVVAVAGRDVVGYALLVSFLSNELHGEVCTIDEFYVDEGWRGGGVGTSLMTALMAGRIRRFRGAVALELEVTPRNRRARALYERLGFAPRKNATMRLLRAG
jgi:GNAT superfamily N-acetyltransferase